MSINQVRYIAVTLTNKILSSSNSRNVLDYLAYSISLFKLNIFLSIYRLPVQIMLALIYEQECLRVGLSYQESLAPYTTVHLCMHKQIRQYLYSLI